MFSAKKRSHCSVLNVGYSAFVSHTGFGKGPTRMGVGNEVNQYVYFAFRVGLIQQTQIPFFENLVSNGLARLRGPLKWPSSLKRLPTPV